MLTYDLTCLCSACSSSSSASPCPTCCPNLPNTLFMTITGAGACSCADGTYPLVLNGAGISWEYSGTLCGDAFNINLQCSDFACAVIYLLTHSCDALPTATGATSYTCSPFIVTFADVPGPGFCCPGGTLDIVITT